MKVQSNTKPTSIEIKNLQDATLLIFAENVVEELKEETTLYTYDEYRLMVPVTKNLEKRVTENLESWLTKAKQAELDKLAKEVREKRNQLLAETDFYFLSDRELDSAKRGALEAYRQALRDITKQKGFPYEIKWPEVG